MQKELIHFIKSSLSLPEKSIFNTVKLIDEGATIPFISRYRKEVTGSLDEMQVQAIVEHHKLFKDLIARKEFILSSIEEQDKLTSSLKNKIEACWDNKLLEDLYLPFKRKKQTRAGIARAAGLEPLANIIFWSKTNNLERSARQFLNKKIGSTEEAIAGARDIIAENINEHSVSREITRDVFSKTARLTAKLIKGKDKEAEKYKNYFEFDQAMHKVPSHRLLAIYRAETEKLLRVKITIDEERLLSRLSRYYIKEKDECSVEKTKALKDAVKRLLIPSISTEFKNQAKDNADDEAIEVFVENLRQLLLAPPLGTKNILAIDPGFRSGCKVAILDDNGTYISNKTIFPHPPQNQEIAAKESLLPLLKKYKIQAVAVGNGTAGRETIQWLKTWINEEVEVHLVNESGASIYSASEVARAEFPKLDLTVRGAISIGRRLMDPLAELVKIEAKNIGVGQYQHDVKQSKLKNRLDQVVINCVNRVGVNVNTASKHLLQYVSGLGPKLADNIIHYRNENDGIDSRMELKKVARMGSKAYEQCAGFLRVSQGKNVLDNTGVHPESYKLVNQMAKGLGVKPNELISSKELLEQINVSDYVSENIGLPTLNDIIKELKKPGIDPRGEASIFHYSEGIHTIEDLSIGIKVKGIINNLTKFGAFVDIGIKENGLIHISQITNEYISDPSEKLKLGQQVEARVMDIDRARKRISLTLK